MACVQELAKDTKMEPEKGAVPVKKEMKQEEVARCFASCEWSWASFFLRGRGSFPVAFGV